ncbi:hypothetical protein JK628_23115 (plasmid) [Shewanella sp. KX20019]|uniref:hypothetical protein n=1 Tax=Shewanella sp. KX20019 TaxID=2803864 RepID=UPI0019269D6F|nr:hypothetical protein [Shewanella sp. KX20019]QQX82705.1 hypothetical protein JK628_23115 [Shewanella sp. KX20019]
MTKIKLVHDNNISFILKRWALDWLEVGNTLNADYLDEFSKAITEERTVSDIELYNLAGHAERITMNQTIPIFLMKRSSTDSQEARHKQTSIEAEELLHYIFD